LERVHLSEHIALPACLSYLSSRRTCFICSSSGAVAIIGANASTQGLVCAQKRLLKLLVANILQTRFERKLCHHQRDGHSSCRLSSLLPIAQEQNLAVMEQQSNKCNKGSSLSPIVMSLLRSLHPLLRNRQYHTCGFFRRTNRLFLLAA